MINLALPKGRLGTKIFSLLSDAGYFFPEMNDDTRKLFFEDTGHNLRCFWVKPFDVPVYVERGAADIGIAGKDILMEREPDIYELSDLKAGKCIIASAGKIDFIDEPSRTLRVATEFPNITRKFYAQKGRETDIITLRGSLELAPVLGLSDVIVDIVETGTTLRENNLHVIEKVAEISARLTANKSAYHFKGEAIKEIIRRITQ